MAFKFDNTYEKNVYDEWNRTIKRMDLYRIRKQYYPHRMEMGCCLLFKLDRYY